MNNFLLVADKHLFKGVLILLVNLEPEVAKERIGMNVVHVLLGGFVVTRNGPVDPFISNQDPALESDRFTEGQVLSSIFLGIFDGNIFVVKQYTNIVGHDFSHSIKIFR